MATCDVLYEWIVHASGRCVWVTCRHCRCNNSNKITQQSSKEQKKERNVVGLKILVHHTMAWIDKNRERTCWLHFGHEPEQASFIHMASYRCHSRERERERERKNRRHKSESTAVNHDNGWRLKHGAQQTEYMSGKKAAKALSPHKNNNTNRLSITFDWNYHSTLFVCVTLASAIEVACGIVILLPIHSSIQRWIFAI